MRFALALTLLIPTLAFADYDPLAVDSAKPEVKDFTVKDAARSREIPIRIYLPKETSRAPVILFSHGLGGSREGNEYTGMHWARRGYVVVALQHPGSDESVWKGVPILRRMAAMKKAANAENFLLRVKDVPAVLDWLAAEDAADRAKDGKLLSGRLDMKRVGMSGHSFGAVTTQAVSGQKYPLAKSLTDERIKAAVVMSPSSPRAGSVENAFGDVKIPWLLLTGTHDTSPLGEFEVESRLAVFPALAKGNKYELVLDNAEHSAFTDRALPGDALKRNPNHHKAILALTTAFWDSYLRDNADARKWLDGDGPRSILEKKDSWKTK